MAASPKVGGHPSMANIMQLAQHHAKLKQGKQKMDFEILKTSTHAKKTSLDIKKMRTQAEVEAQKSSLQMKMMKAKTKNGYEDLDLKKANHKLEKERHAFKKRTQKRNVSRNSSQARKASSAESSKTRR